MADSTGPDLIDPMKASTLLELEGSDVSVTLPAATSPEARRTGLWIRGLDTRFRALWRSGRVIGIGTTDDMEDAAGQGRPSLSLHLLATALLAQSTRSQTVTAGTPEKPTPQTVNVYIIAPHTYQTIPMLHALLAKTLSDSPAAIELLKGVQLLQYFDFAGLAEAVAEISEAVYQRTQPDKDGYAVDRGRLAHAQMNDIVLIQGLGQTVTATQRRSGHVHANALLAGLTRNIAQLSRTFGHVLVLVDAPVEVGLTSANELGHETPPAKRFSTGLELYSAFSGPRGESLRLVCGNETLSRTLEGAFDCMVVVHDGFTRLKESDKSQGQSLKQIIEVTKDRLGDSTGLWAVWTSTS